MRLTSNQKNKIISALESFLKTDKAELRLYGSRTKDTLRGGDIDLLLLLNSPDSLAKFNENKHHILSTIKKNLGDQKIDLLIATKHDTEQNVFLKLIYPESILLKKWN